MTASQAPPGLLDAFHAYEQALMSDDLATMDRLFAPGDGTLRGDADGLLVGHGSISRFRNGRGGAPPRHIVETHVRVIDDDHALIVAVTEPLRGGRGQQTQLWRRNERGDWQVAAAHVSAPAPAYDGRIWRVVGDPLVPPAASGPLDGETVAVKDLFAVAGHRVGAGNPAWLEAATPEPEHAAAVRSLLEAGAAVRGIARTDELAYSLAGQNAHYGTPPNPRAPRRIPGGSSSGSATAVSLGHATIGLGTDTGGSIRVPAAYQGLYGIRTTHGAVDRTGLLPLAPSFDTIGWMTRSAELLRAVGEVLLPEPDTGGPGTPTLVVVPSLLQLAHPEVVAAVTRGAPYDTTVESWPLDRLRDWLDAFQIHQAHQAWQAHGDWLADRLDTLGPDVRGRFERGSRLDPDAVTRAAGVVEEAGRIVRDLVGDRILVLPSAASVAPLPEQAAATRDATMRLTCLAGLGGLPAVTVPTSTDDGLPMGVCLVAAPGRDRDLLALAGELTAWDPGVETPRPGGGSGRPKDRNRRETLGSTTATTVS